MGAASMASPMYIAEISPARIRGRMVSLNQLAIVFGMLAVYLVNYTIASSGDETWNVEVGWRWMFGSGVLPALALFLLVVLRAGEPPLAGQAGTRGRGLSRAVTHQRFAGWPVRKSPRSRMPCVMRANRSGSCSRRGCVWCSSSAWCWPSCSRSPASMCFCISRPRYSNASPDRNWMRRCCRQIVVGAVNMSFTIVAIWTVDRLGRKPLMVFGYVGMGISLLALGLAAHLQRTETWVLLFMLTYIAAFALSVGPVTWVILSEIFPTKIRGRAMAIATVCLWMAQFRDFADVSHDGQERRCWWHGSITHFRSTSMRVFACWRSSSCWRLCRKPRAARWRKLSSGGAAAGLVKDCQKRPYRMIHVQERVARRSRLLFSRSGRLLWK